MIEISSHLLYPGQRSTLRPDIHTFYSADTLERVHNISPIRPIRSERIFVFRGRHALKGK